MTWLVDPWQDPLVRRAFLEVLLLGAAGGALGCWVVFHGLVYAGESLAHALLPGLVVAALAGFPLVLGGAAGVLVAAVAIALAGRLPELGRDTATAVVVTVLFGLGVLLALSPDAPPRLQELLFGDPLGLDDGDLARAGALALAVVGVLVAGHHRLLAVGFDRGTARGLGVRAGVVDVVLLGLLAPAVLVATDGLGNLLVIALLVAPAAAARRLVRRMGPMLLAAAAIAVLAGWAGLYLSFHADTSAGASIVLALLAAYGAAAVGARVAGRA